jgi:hypothetical protein
MTTLVIESNTGKRYTCHNRREVKRMKAWLRNQRITFHLREVANEKLTKFADQ